MDMDAARRFEKRWMRAGTGARWNPYPFLSPLPGLLRRQLQYPGLAPGAIYLTALRACQYAIAPAEECGRVEKLSLPGRRKRSGRNDVIARQGKGVGEKSCRCPGRGGRWIAGGEAQRTPGWI